MRKYLLALLCLTAPAAFASIPAEWRALLTGWTAEREQAVVDAVRSVSAEREIAPPDPFRALRVLSPERVRVVVAPPRPIAVTWS